MINNNKKIAPVLKWAGGKRQIISILMEKMPTEFNTYYEPFIGGGSVLFALVPEHAVVGDLNSELINVYNVIKTEPELLIDRLRLHSKMHNKEYYYYVRSLDRDKSYYYMPDVEKAARTIYLNRTCYNGLYRVNNKGFFNTPIGKYANPTILDEKMIRSICDYFNNNKIEIICDDFSSITKNASCNDLVYFDPPYDTEPTIDGFTDYTQQGFTREEQYRLKKEFDRLAEKGVSVMESNANTQFIQELYKDYSITVLTARRAINSKGDGRTAVEEVLITNY